MTVDSRIRMRIHQKFEELLGPEEADAVVEELFGMSWGQVATKDDVRVLGAELRGEMYKSFAAQTRWFIAANTALAGVYVAAATLF